MLGKTLVRAYATAPRAVLSTLLLARSPVVTADLPAFESEYYKYQNGLWKRLMWTFPKWFYYREGTLSEQNYRELNKNPVYNNPNIEFPRGRPEIKHQRDRRFKQDINLPKTYKEGKELEEDDVTPADSLSRKIVPNSRTTAADEAGDLTSLERRLARTLYLVVATDGQTWRFPRFPAVDEATPLHTLAENELYRLGGNQINYFNVSNTPCHLHEGTDGKEFFIRSHILSGKFQPQEKTVKHLWLTKEELGGKLDAAYYTEIQHLLSDV